MALQTLVSVSNISSLSEARYCAGMGVDLLGFCLDPHHPAYVAPARFQEIRGWLAGVSIVGETNSTDPAQIQALLETYRPDRLQVDGLAVLPFLRTLAVPLIVRIDLTNAVPGTLPDRLHALAQTTLPATDYLLLAGLPLPDATLLAALQTVVARHAVLVATDQPNAVLPLLAHLPLAGITLTNGPQRTPGSPTFDELMDWLEGLEAAD